MAHAATTESAPARRSFESNRLASLFAILPLGVWTFFHLWNNLAAFDGAQAWQRSVTEYPHPVAQIATAILVLVPLFWHLVWGLFRLKSTRPNYGSYGYFANLKYSIQRLSAIGLVLFLGAHLWLALIHPRLVEGHAEPFNDIAAEMRWNGPTMPVYVLGVLGIAYHLANGISTFAMGWGLVTSRTALRRLDYVVWAVFIVMLAMGWSAIFALWSAGGALPKPVD